MTTKLTNTLLSMALGTCVLQAQTLGKVIPLQDPSYNAEERKAVHLGSISIAILSTYFWRDWMPIVSNPGPDRGSPLRVKLGFWIENRGTENLKLTYSVVIVDAKGQSYPMPSRVQPNFHVLSDKVAAAYRDGDEATKTKLIAEHRVMWDGLLNAGEGREVDLTLSDGPYLPVGSRVHAEITWTDAQGRTVLVKTPEASIQRTD